MPKNTDQAKDDIYRIPIIDANGQTVDLSPWRKKVLLIVNVASRCGFTSQYQQLQQLQLKFQNAGFSVLAFPCNQFMRQEPGSASQIKSFCESNFQTTFPLFAKIKVNGKNTAPLYNFLKENLQHKPWIAPIPWNFTKFLVNGHGEVIKRYSPLVPRKIIEKDIERLLAAKL